MGVVYTLPFSATRFAPPASSKNFSPNHVHVRFEALGRFVFCLPRLALRAIAFFEFILFASGLTTACYFFFSSSCVGSFSTSPASFGRKFVSVLRLLNQNGAPRLSSAAEMRMPNK